VVAVLFNFAPQTLKMGTQEYLIIKLSFKRGLKWKEIHGLKKTKKANQDEV
jgi:hypothetical protein